MNRSFLRIFLVVLLSSAAFMALSAADVVVDYLEGSLEYRSGNSAWIAADTGDRIPEGSTIRFRSTSGSVQLSSDDRRATISDDGTYRISDVFADRSDGTGIIQAIGAKFSFLLNRQGNDSLTTAGVRASGPGDSTRWPLPTGGAMGRNDESMDDDFISWADEFADYLRDGQAAFAEGDYVSAGDSFFEGTKAETGGILRECEYRLALCHWMMNEDTQAIERLKSVNPDPDDPFFGEYSVVTGSILIEKNLYDDAEALLSGYLEADPEGEQAQEAWYLSAVAHFGSGDRPSGISAARNAVNLGPDTPAGRASAELLE